MTGYVASGAEGNRILRGFLIVVAAAALLFVGLWTYESMNVLRPGFGGRYALSEWERDRLVPLSVLGIGAFIAVGASGLMYVRTAANAWLAGIVAGAVCGITVFLVWWDLYSRWSGTANAAPFA